TCPMKPHDIFHERLTALGRGGRFVRPSGFVPALVSRSRQQIKTMTKKIRRKVSIYFDVYDSELVDAIALPYEGKHYIGVSIGTATFLMAVFNRILSDPGLLPQVGKVDKETPGLPLFDSLALPPRESALYDSIVNHGAISPKCETRKMYALHLFLTS